MKKKKIRSVSQSHGNSLKSTNAESVYDATQMISILDQTHNNSKFFNQLFYNLGSGYSSRMGG